MEDTARDVEACAGYFRKNKAYTRMFGEMKKKYIKYGKLTGKIRMDQLSEEECKALGAVFGKSLLPGDFEFSISELQAALGETKYGNVEVESLIEAYFCGKIISNSQKKKEEKKLKESFWESLLNETGNRFGYEAEGSLWLSTARKERKYGYKLIMMEREKSEAILKEMLAKVCHALEYLSQKNKDTGIRLAVLGAEITKNPHYFDRQNPAGRLLVSALSFTYDLEEPQAQEDVLALYYMSGIQPDDISSYTTCYGIHFYEGDSEHEAYKCFIEKGEKYVLTLSNLNRLTRADSIGKKVYIIENQMVFSQICEEMQGKEYSMMCTSGQLRTASLFLIDMLVKSGCELYYCGDMDPEGIGIADKVLARSPKQIFLWRMTEADYYRTISDETLTETRLKKLEKIVNGSLRELAHVLKKEKRAGYQERLIDLMVGDIVGVSGM